MTVAVIAESPVFCSGLVKLLTDHHIPVVGEAYTGKTGLSLARQQKPSIALIDAYLPDMTGEAVCRWLQRHATSLASIFFLNPVHWPTLSRLVETPAQGFLSKEAYYSSIEVVKLVSAGKTYLQPDLALGLLHYRAHLPANALDKLSTHEYEVLARLAQGKTYEAIADAIPLSVKTVYNLKTSACKKLGIVDREQVCRLFPF